MAEKLLNYGCWCRFVNQEDIHIYEGEIVGHGAPVDAIDAACKEWHQCRSCRTRDYESCDSWPDFAGWFDEDTRRLDCNWNPRFECVVSFSF